MCKGAANCKLIRTKHVNRQSARTIQREAGDIKTLWWNLEEGFHKRNLLFLKQNNNEVCESYEDDDSLGLGVVSQLVKAWVARDKKGQNIGLERHFMEQRTLTLGLQRTLEEK